MLNRFDAAGAAGRHMCFVVVVVCAMAVAMLLSSVAIFPLWLCQFRPFCYVAISSSIVLPYDITSVIDEVPSDAELPPLVPNLITRYL